MFIYVSSLMIYLHTYTPVLSISSITASLGRVIYSVSLDGTSLFSLKFKIVAGNAIAFVFTERFFLEVIFSLKVLQKLHCFLTRISKATPLLLVFASPSMLIIPWPKSIPSSNAQSYLEFGTFVYALVR